MTIKVGDKLPEATLQRMGANGPEDVSLSTFTKGKKVVIFSVPAAYSGTCTNAHVPSFMRTYDQFRAKGVSNVICISGNDAFVMDAWGKSTGAAAKGLVFLGDPSGAYARATGLNVTVPAIGFYDRIKRNAMYVEDGVVKVLNFEEKPGVCDMTGGETLLEQI